MGSWNLYVENASLEWPVTPTSTVPRPNDDLVLGTLTTQQQVPLADGTIGFYSPEHHSTRQEMQFTWYMKDDTFRQEIENYIINHSYIKIVTHLNEEYIGRFTAISSKWLVGESPDEFEIVAGFMRMV